MDERFFVFWSSDQILARMQLSTNQQNNVT